MDILKLEDFKKDSSKISLEYDSSEDLFDLKINSTSEITPEEANCIVSLISEGQRIRAEYFKKGKL